MRRVLTPTITELAARTVRKRRLRSMYESVRGYVRTVRDADSSINKYKELLVYQYVIISQWIAVRLRFSLLRGGYVIGTPFDTTGYTTTLSRY